MTVARMGVAAGSSFSMTGGFVPGGNWSRMVATLSRTSLAATSTGFSRTKVTKTWEIPSLVVERSSSIPLMVLTTSSMGLVIWLSTSSGVAPSRVVVTVKLHPGEGVQPQVAIGGQPQHHQGHDEHGGEDGPADAQIAQAHDGSIKWEIGNWTLETGKPDGGRRRSAVGGRQGRLKSQMNAEES